MTIVTVNKAPTFKVMDKKTEGVLCFQITPYILGTSPSEPYDKAIKDMRTLFHLPAIRYHLRGKFYVENQRLNTRETSLVLSEKYPSIERTREFYADKVISPSVKLRERYAKLMQPTSEDILTGRK